MGLEPDFKAPDDQPACMFDKKLVFWYGLNALDCLYICVSAKF